jgi:hypothetical protein
LKSTVSTEPWERANAKKITQRRSVFIFVLQVKQEKVFLREFTAAKSRINICFNLAKSAKFSSQLGESN